MNSSGLDVAFVTQGWTPDRGGVETHTELLARGLAERGHRVHVLALDYGEGLEPYSLRDVPADGVSLTRLAYRYHDHRSLADLIRNPRCEELLRGWLERTPCHLVHVHHLTGFGAGALRVVAELGQPLVMTLHDYWMLCPRGQMFDPDGRRIEEPLAEECGACLARTWPHLMPSGGAPGSTGPAGEPTPDDAAAAGARTRYAVEMLALPQRLIVPSAAAYKAYARAGAPYETLEIIEHGLEVEALARACEEQRSGRASDGRLHVGVLGAVLPSKGVLELIGALALAPELELALDVHGDLPPWHGSRDYVERVRAAAGTDPRVTLHGPFEPADLPRVLAGLDLVAAPALWDEVFGLSVREARAVGLPVLVSDVGGLGSCVQGSRAGAILPAGDRAAWAEALRRFAGDAELRRAWGAEPSAVRSASEMVLETEATYGEVVLENGGTLPPLEHPIAGLPGQETDTRTAAMPEREGSGHGWLRRMFGRRG